MEAYVVKKYLLSAFLFLAVGGNLMANSDSGERCHGYCFLRVTGFEAGVGYEYEVQTCADCNIKFVVCANGAITTPGHCANCTNPSSCQGIDLPAGCSEVVKTPAEPEDRFTPNN